MSTLRRVRTGDKLRIPAGDWNACMDVARAHLARRENLGAALRCASLDSAIVPIKNESGADRARFDVLGVTGPLFTPTDNAEEFLERVALRGTMPDIEHTGAFAILLEPLRTNEIGRAILNGLTVARVRMVDETHQHADVYAGTATELQSSQSGLARLLWIEPVEQRTDPDVAWTVARLGGGGGAAGGQWQIARIVARGGTTPANITMTCEWPEGGEAFFVRVFAYTGWAGWTTSFPALETGDLVPLAPYGGDELPYQWALAWPVWRVCPI